MTTINLAEIPYFEQSDTEQHAHKNTSQIVLSRLKTSAGDLLAGATNKGICLLEFCDTNDRIDMQIERLEKGYSTTIIAASSPFFTGLNAQLQDYFAGTLQHFTVPLDTVGTDFQQEVWQTLQKIPFGETFSYQQQAEVMGKPKAVRAVANANRNNKICILIPCHRVIGKDGSMTGYAGGIWRKELLLELESKGAPGS